MAEYKINYTQSNFTGGIIAAELYGRNDFNKVKSGLKKCTNWTIREAGGLEFRRGTRYEAVLPSGVNKFKMASLDTVLLLFCEDGIRYLSEGSWYLISYPENCTPNLDKLQFTELQQKLYFYDGAIDLCQIVLYDGIPSVYKTIFEKGISGIILDSETLGALPEVSVLVDHTYTVALAKDSNHESIVSELTTTQHTNTELSQASNTEDNKAVQVNVNISLSDSLMQEYAQGKIYIYKKYQGYFYFLSAIDVKDPTPGYITLRSNADRYVRLNNNDLTYRYGWRGTNDVTYYTNSETPSVGDSVYVYGGISSTSWQPSYTAIGTVDSVSSVGGTTHISVNTIDCTQNNTYDAKTIYCWVGDDSHYYYTNSIEDNEIDYVYKYVNNSDTPDSNGEIKSFIHDTAHFYIFTSTSDDRYIYTPSSNLPYLYAWRGSNDVLYYTEKSEPEAGDTVYIKNNNTKTMDVFSIVTSYDGTIIVVNGVNCSKEHSSDRSAIYAWVNGGTTVYTKASAPYIGDNAYNQVSESIYTIYFFIGDYYVFEDKGQFSVDMSKTPKENPFYLNEDGSVTGVNSIADYGQRLFLTQSNQNVTRIIFSAVGNTDCLASSVQPDESEAGNLELPISHYDSWSKVVSGLDLILSTSYTVNKVSGIGTLTTDTILWDGLSKTVEPVKTRRSIIYTNSSNRNIYDLTYNEYGQYDSVDLTLLIKYIFETKTIKRLAFKDFPVKTIYVLCEDGDLYCLTYIKDQNIYAWYKIEHAGTIEDLIVINTDVEDEICMIINYNGIHILERAYNRTDNVYMDCVVRKNLTEISNNTITGLDIFEGQKVRVFDTGNNMYYGDYDIMNPQTIVEGGNVVEIDDLPFDGFIVSNGTISLPNTIELVGDVLIGLPYYAVMETIPLEFSDQNGNSTIGRKKTINEAYLRYGDSRGLTYKTMGHEYDCEICSKDVADNAQFLERGQVKLHTVSEYKWDSTIKILQRQPYPARIESITLGLTFNDKS